MPCLSTVVLNISPLNASGFGNGLYEIRSVTVLQCSESMDAVRCCAIERLARLVGCFMKIFANLI